MGNANATGSGDAVAILVIVLIVLLGVFLVCREIVCWYWKINERLAVLRELLAVSREIRELARGGAKPGTGWIPPDKATAGTNVAQPPAPERPASRPAPTDNDLWHVKWPSGSTATGTLDQLDDAYQAGTINEETLVRRDGTGDWITLAQAAGLKGRT